MSHTAASPLSNPRLDAVLRAVEAVNAERSLAFRIDTLAVARAGGGAADRPLGIAAVLRLRSGCSGCSHAWLDLLRDRRTIYRLLSEAGPAVHVCDFETLIEQRTPYAIVYGIDPCAVAIA